jgi:sugar phosphate isomerase/epimerase
LVVTRRIWGPDPIAKVERAVEVASDAEVPVVVMHPPYRWQTEYRGWIEETLPVVEERSGVTVAIENMFPMRVGNRQITFHANQDLAALDGIPHLVLDTSHAAVARHDLVPVRQRFGDRLRHVHLSDNLGRGWDNHLPPGDGVLPLDDFLEDLAGSDYSGSVSLEVDLRKETSDPARVRAVMTSMRERVERRLAAA